MTLELQFTIINDNAFELNVLSIENYDLKKGGFITYYDGVFYIVSEKNKKKFDKLIEVLSIKPAKIALVGYFSINFVLIENKLKFENQNDAFFNIKQMLYDNFKNSNKIKFELSENKICEYCTVKKKSFTEFSKLFLSRL